MIKNKVSLTTYKTTKLITKNYIDFFLQFLVLIFLSQFLVFIYVNLYLLTLIFIII